MLITAIIISIIIVLGFYSIKSKSSKPKALIANSPLSPMHGWDFTEDLKEPKYASWDDLLSSKLVDPKAIHLQLDADNNFHVGNYDYESKSPPQVKRYNLDDLVFVDYRSSADSWRHLAGRQGYVVISKSEKKQIDFIVTVMS
ncbi:hypothetical protein ACFSNA_19690 [Pedobacter mendelii]